MLPRLPVSLGTINLIQKNASLINKEARPSINEENKIIVIPYMVVSGTTILTDTGEYHSNEDLENYGQRKVLWDGKNAVILFPKGWGHLVAKDKNGKVIYDKSKPATHLEKHYNESPTFHDGLIQSHSQETAISNSNLFHDIKETQNVEQLIMVFTKWQPNQNDLEYFYEIPEVDPNTWYKIDNATTEYVEGKFNKTICVFTSINDELSASGRAVDQYFHRGAPGEGYPRYTIIYDKQSRKKIPKLNRNFLSDTPITNIQLEIYGSAIFSGLTLMGRDVKSEIINIIKPSYMLFFNKILNNIPTQITKQSLPVSTYYAITRGHTDIRFYFKDLEDKWASYYNEETRPNTQGFYVIEESIDELRSTTRIVKSDGNPWVGGNNLPLPVDGSLANFHVRSKVWDDYEFWIKTKDVNKITHWLGLQPFIKSSKAQYDDSTDYPYMKLFKKTSGADSFKTTLHDFINLMSLYNWDTIKMPMDFTTVTSFSPGSLPLIGGLINQVGLGKIWKWQGAQTWTPSKLFWGLIPTITAEYCATYINLAKKVDRVIIPLGLLRNDTSDTSTPLIGTKSQNTVIRLSITNKIQRNGKTLYTYDLAQKNGWAYDPLTDKCIYHDSIKNIGFVIDALILKTVSKANFKITFFNGDISVWEGRYQTESKWDGNDRSYTTALSLSPWNSNLNNHQTFVYPLPYNPKNPPSKHIDKLNYYFNPLGNVCYFKPEDINKEFNITWANDKKQHTDTITTSVYYDMSDNFYVHIPKNYHGDIPTLNYIKGTNPFFSNVHIKVFSKPDTYTSYPHQTWPIYDTTPDHTPHWPLPGNFYADAAVWEDYASMPYAYFWTDYYKISVEGPKDLTYDFTKIDPSKGINIPFYGNFQYNERSKGWIREEWTPPGGTKFTMNVNIKWTDKTYDPATQTFSGKNMLNVTYTLSIFNPIYSGRGNLPGPLGIFKYLEDVYGKTMNKSIVDYFNHSFYQFFINNISFNK